jgi:LPPG:FO 2-phospho-L-lactate transferase
VIVVLAGGTGAAKLVRGLAAVVDPTRLLVIGNTGDDLEWWGLHVSPDLDSVIYALAGCLDPGRGWGRRDETFHCREAMAAFGRETWFQLGDRDLATHLHRTLLLRHGLPLSAATRAITEALGVAAQVLPMSDDPVRTEIETPEGWLSLEEFFVRERCQPDVRRVEYVGAHTAAPAPGVTESIRGAEAVVVGCSNPVTSIGPILAVPGIVESLGAARAPVVAVSPIVGDAAVSGPAGKLLVARGLAVSALSVADLYRPWLSALVVDRTDAWLEPELGRRGVRAVVADTLMTDAASEAALARTTLAAAGVTP